MTLLEIILEKGHIDVVRNLILQYTSFMKMENVGATYYTVYY